MFGKRMTDEIFGRATMSKDHGLTNLVANVKNTEIYSNKMTRKVIAAAVFLIVLFAII